MTWASEAQSWDEVCRRASARRHFNSVRKLRAEIRRFEIADYVRRHGLPYGAQKLPAVQFKVSRATICKDLREIRRSYAPCPSCGRYREKIAAHLEKGLKQRNSVALANPKRTKTRTTTRRVRVAAAPSSISRLRVSQLWSLVISFSPAFAQDSITDFYGVLRMGVFLWPTRLQPSDLTSVSIWPVPVGVSIISIFKPCEACSSQTNASKLGAKIALVLGRLKRMPRLCSAGFFQPLIMHGHSFSYLRDFAGLVGATSASANPFRGAFAGCA